MTACKQKQFNGDLRSTEYFLTVFVFTDFDFVNKFNDTDLSKQKCNLLLDFENINNSSINGFEST